MNNNAKVSIIIPTYNYGFCIEQSIRSVIRQTHQDFEVIVVDDGSNDDTQQVVQSIEDRRIKYIYQQNQGANVARNRGFYEACGDYIIFLDSDDMLAANHLEEYLGVANSNLTANIYGPGKKGYLSNYGFQVWYEMKRCPSEDLLENWITANWWAFSCCIMWPKDNVIRAGGWDESLHANQDGDIAMRALIEGTSFVYAENAPEALITMHNEKQSITSTKNIATLSSRYEVLKKIENFLKNKNMLNNKYNTALALAFFSIAKNTLSSFPEFSDSCYKEFRRLYGYKKPPGSYMNWLGLSILGLRKKQKLADLVGRKIPWRF